MGTFKYENKEGTVHGEFNIYQAKSGAIMLVMGNAFIGLTLDQIELLHLDCYGLMDFDPYSFHHYYGIPKG